MFAIIVNHKTPYLLTTKTKNKTKTNKQKKPPENKNKTKGLKPKYKNQHIMSWFFNAT
jgi:hypothetical protein